MGRDEHFVRRTRRQDHRRPVWRCILVLTQVIRENLAKPVLVD